MVIDCAEATDTGTYFVRAVNEAGEASSGAEFEIRPPPPLEEAMAPPRPPSPIIETVSPSIPDHSVGFY